MRSKSDLPNETDSPHIMTGNRKTAFLSLICGMETPETTQSNTAGYYHIVNFWPLLVLISRHSCNHFQVTELTDASNCPPGNQASQSLFSHSAWDTHSLPHTSKHSQYTVGNPTHLEESWEETKQQNYWCLLLCHPEKLRAVALSPQRLSSRTLKNCSWLSNHFLSRGYPSPQTVLTTGQPFIPPTVSNTSCL